jgi:predicted metalloendopeptidase
VKTYGDLGGVNAAYDGLLYLKENGNPGLIDGYTPEQRFFISWSTIWRSKCVMSLENQVKQIHSQECTVRMCLCKTSILLSSF